MRTTYESTKELAKIHHYKEAPDGFGYFKVTHITPDKSNIGNDRFYFYYEAWVYAKDLKAKGYHDVSITGAR